MYHVESTNKYRNESQTYNGYTYQSKFEAGFAKDLDLQLKAKQIKKWDRQVRIELRVNGTLIANYYMDFVVIDKTDSITHVECKGFETEVWRLKRKLYEATYLVEHPEVEYKVLKQKNNYKNFINNLPKGVKIRSSW